MKKMKKLFDSCISSQAVNMDKIMRVSRETDFSREEKRIVDGYFSRI